MNEDKATRYQRSRRRAQAGSIAATTAVLVSLLAGSGALRLRDAGEAVAGVLVSAGASSAWGVLLAGVTVVVLLSLLLGLVALPFSLFRDWALDRRYGLDRVPIRAWLVLHLKGALVGLLLAVGALLMLHATVALSPVWWWLVAALALGAAQVGVTTAVPWLLPFFARLRPLTRGGLGARLDALAKRARAGSSLSVYEWHDQAAVRRAQAALVGLGRTRRVLLSDTLLEAFADDEIEVIVAHELAHHVHRDLWKGAASRFMTLVVGLALAQVLLLWMGSGDTGARGPTDPAALPLIALVVGGVGVILSPLVLASSRQQERRADAFSLALTRNPDAFIRVMRRMAALNLAEDRPSPLGELLFASHPSVTERIAAARAWRDAAN